MVLVEKKSAAGGLYISAAHKSSGKTTISLGLCAALKDRQITIQPFKKGPDFIDPLWLKQASSRACYNLDFFTSSEQEIKNLYSSKSLDADITIIEGNKGLYDGMDLHGADSNAALANLLDLPVVLVINTQGITRGIAPLLLGYQGFDKAPQIAGVILNNVAGSRHESKLISVVEEYTDIPVIGSVRRSSSLVIDERHLGLMPSNEASESEAIITAIKKTVEAQVDLDNFIQLARPPALQGFSSVIDLQEEKTNKVKIGIFKDAAFGFYYEDDLEKISHFGGELIEINALQDASLPEVDGLFIGGGFPETHMQQLAANSELMRAVKTFIENDGVVYAECGGLMYLAQSLTWNGNECKMSGVIPGNIEMSEKPQGRGYIKLVETDQHPWPGKNTAVLSAHEFHYSALTDLPDDAVFAYQVKRGCGIDGAHDGFVYKNLLANYAHMRNVGSNHWAERFVNKIIEVKGNN